MDSGESIRWGIIGCGRISGKFCRSMAPVADGVITACASQSPERAEAFGDRHGVEHRFDSYERMLESGRVDAVYIGTTHNFHCENILLALDHGKPVLCEKPLTVSAAQAETVIAKARAKNCFLMEALWSRFLPAFRRMKELVDDGVIGDIRMIRADFCFRAPWNLEGRLFNPALAGGALLDVGIYPVSTASFLMGRQPERIKVAADIGQTGVDEQGAYLFEYDDGRIAILSSAVSSPSRNRLEVAGTEGMIILPDSFHRSPKLELHREGVIEVEEHPFNDEEGFRFEIEAVHGAIRAGKKECALMPLDESLAIARTMDEIRRQFDA